MTATTMQEQSRVFSKVARRIIPLMVALYTVSFLDRVNVGFAALTMNKDLHFTPEIYGWGAGIFFFGYFLFEVPSNVILARVGARRWICRIMLTWGLISAGMAFVQGPMSFYVLRFLLGLAEAGFAPGMIFYLSLWFPEAVRARYAASYFIAVPIANVIGAPVSGYILEIDGILGFHGWQWLFVLEAIPALVLAVVVLVYLPDGPRSARWLSEEERSVIAARLEAERPPAHHAAGAVWAALADVRVLVLCAIYFAIVVGLYGVGFWLPQIVQGMGYSVRNTSYIVAIPYAVTVVAMIVWGGHSDRTGERIWHFQAVKHDIWDRDFPSPPTLVTVRHQGKPVDAVAQTTKHGWLYLFERTTGKPLFPVEAKAYPASDVPGETAAATQVLPTKPAPFSRQSLTADMLSTRTPQVHQWAVEQFTKFRSEGQFVPFGTNREVVVFPGFDGGAEWGGSAFDPDTGLLYVNANDVEIGRAHV